MTLSSTWSGVGTYLFHKKSVERTLGQWARGVCVVTLGIRIRAASWGSFLLFYFCFPFPVLLFKGGLGIGHGSSEPGRGVKWLGKVTWSARGLFNSSSYFIVSVPSPLPATPNVEGGLRGTWSQLSSIYNYQGRMMILILQEGEAGRRNWLHGQNRTFY